MIRENLLHFIWRYQKLPFNDLCTSIGEPISVLDHGQYNHLSGPDFFNARIVIGNQQWAGNVEMHVKTSDWYVHGHEKDVKYNNVILHVVWENDISIFRADNTRVATLVLKEYISADLLHAYKALFNKKENTFINCEKQIGNPPAFLLKNWMDRLFLERLEKKTTQIEELLAACEKDWERLLFILLLKSFGSKINGNSFYEIGKELNFSMIRKIQPYTHQLESVLFGTAGLLSNNAIVDQYYRRLQQEFQFLKVKWNIKHHLVIQPEFFRLRPSNFPTIRLSQFANLYQKNKSLFGKLMDASTMQEFYDILDVKPSDYWYDHFTFGKISKHSTKKLSKKFIDLLVINTVIPLRFCYARHRGEDKSESLMTIASEIKKEKNSIIGNFEHLKIPVNNAMDSQALLQMYSHYCNQNKCLDCAIGSNLLNTKE